MYYLEHKKLPFLKGIIMKKKLIAAMLLLATQINGMEETNLLKEDSPNQALSIENDDSIEGSESPGDRVDELEDYYWAQSKVSGKEALRDLDRVFGENIRKSFFQNIILNNKDITNDKALLEFIRVAATTIIKSPEYSNERFSYNPKNGVYKSPFLFSLIEALDPVTRHYMAKVAISVQ